MADYDLLIKNGTIVDGLRMPAYRGDIGIRNGKIVAMGNVQGSATRVVDATGPNGTRMRRCLGGTASPQWPLVTVGLGSLLCVRKIANAPCAVWNAPSRSHFRACRLVCVGTG